MKRRDSRLRGWSIVLATTALSCSRSVPVKQIVAHQSSAGTWNEWFVERRVNFQIPEADAPILRIGKIVVDADGNLLIASARTKRILVFEPNGRLLRAIPIWPDTAGRIHMGKFGLDVRGDLFAHVPEKNAVLVFRAPAYTEVRRIPVRGGIADLVPLPDAGVVTYHPSDPKGAFKRFDARGKQVLAVHPIRNERLRVFHGRVQNGGITQDASGDFFGIEPSTFELIRFSSDLQVKEIFRGDTTNVWEPNARPLPPGLSPGDYKPAHRKWWDSFTHIGQPYALSPGVLLVTLFKSHGLYALEGFASLILTDGRTLVEGLAIPHEGDVVGAARGNVYVVRNARLSNGDSIVPTELYEYRLRNPAAIANAEPRAAIAVAPLSAAPTPRSR